MKKIIISAILLLFPFTTFAEWVNGYMRSDGTYVSGYYRSDRNSTVFDNYSYNPWYGTYSVPTNNTATYTTTYIPTAVKESCSVTYGLGSTENESGNCVCRPGYEWGTGLLKDKCVIKNCYQYGLNAKLDYTTNSCVCKSGYVVKTDYLGNKTCEKESVTKYAILNEVKGTEFKVFFYGTLNYIEYKKISSYNCFNAKNYIGEKILLNIGSDGILNYGDYLILPNSESCDIGFVLPIDKDESIYSCNDIYGSNVEDTYDNKCRCSIGYQWNQEGSGCIPKKISCKKWQVEKNGKCVRK